MKRLLILATLLVIFFGVGFAFQEENPIKISRMEIDLWPDYDRTQMLVIYRVQISNDTQLPARISLRIPNQAVVPYKVAIRDLDGLLYNVEYTLEPQGSWKQVVLTTSSNELYIEYYDPQLLKNEDERNFAFSWICDYPIDKLVIKAQEPRNSKDFTITPELGLGELNIYDNLIYHTGDFGPLASGITFYSQLSYSRTGSELSASNLPLIAATPANQSSSFSKTVSNVITQVLDNRSLATAGTLILIGIVLMIGVSIFASSGSDPLTNYLKRRKKKTSPSDDFAIHIQYCPHCGKRTYPGDRFCRGCGNTI
jgi:hypothetical protein